MNNILNWIVNNSNSLQTGNCYSAVHTVICSRSNFYYQQRFYRNFWKSEIDVFPRLYREKTSISDFMEVLYYMLWCALLPQCNTSIPWLTLYVFLEASSRCLSEVLSDRFLLMPLRGLKLLFYLEFHWSFRSFLFAYLNVI